MFGYGFRAERFISSNWIHMLMSSAKVNCNNFFQALLSPTKYKEYHYKI